MRDVVKIKTNHLATDRVMSENCQLAIREASPELRMQIKEPSVTIRIVIAVMHRSFNI